MKNKSYLMIMLALVVLVSACSDKQDPLKLFIKSDLAATKITTAKYNVVLRVKSPRITDSMTAKVWLKRDNNSPMGLRLRIETSDNSIMTYDGTETINVDKKNNRAMLVRDPNQAMAQASYFGQFYSMIMKKQSDSAAISQQKNLVYNGKESVNGTKCYLVTQEVKDKDTLSNQFYFGVDNSLIYKFLSKIISQESEYMTEISNMELDGNIDDKNFTQIIPAGFKTDTVNVNPDAAAQMDQKVPEEENNLLKNGTKAPDFSLLGSNGKTYSMKDFAGKVVVLDFWATWCKPCQMAMPLIQNVHKQYKNKGVVVIGISSNERDGNPAESMKKLGCDYLLLLNGEKITESYLISGFPTLYVIDKKGMISHGEVGYNADLDKKLSGIIDGLIK